MKPVIFNFLEDINYFNGSRSIAPQLPSRAGGDLGLSGGERRCGSGLVS